MPNGINTPRNDWLRSMSGSLFEVREDASRRLLVAKEGALDKRHETLLAALGSSGLLVSEAMTYDGRISYPVPEGTAPLATLHEQFVSGWSASIQSLFEQAHEISDLPVDGLSRYLVHLNLVDGSEEAVRLMPSCVELLDGVQSIGALALTD